MGFWSIVKPLETTNLVANPSVEIDTTGFTAVGGSIARSTAQQKFGVASLAVTPTSGTTDGAYYGTVSLTNAITYTYSVFVKGVLGVPYKIYFANTSGTLKGSAATFTGTGAWQRVEVTWACDSTASYRLYVTKNTSSSTGVFYVDALLVEAQSAATTYVDGDQDGCTWSGAAHTSTSSRSGQSRAGGQVVDLEDIGLNVREMPGIGMPPLKHLTQAQATRPGALFRGTKAMARVFELYSQFEADDWVDLHEMRSQVIDLLKPDAVGEEQAVLLKYTGTGGERDIYAVLDTGLGFNQVEAFLEEAKIRLIAYDPFWYEVGNQAAVLSTSQSFTSNNIAQRINGLWGAMGSGMNGAVYSIAIGPDGSVYAAGNFTTAGGVTVNYIAKWNGSAWSALGAGMNGAVNAITFGPDGKLYATGDFTVAGGITVNRVAVWNGSAWSALGTGLNNTGSAIVFGTDGKLYVGGGFTTAGGVTVNYIAKWNGSAWSALGAGMNNIVTTLAIGLDNSLYAGGNFTTAGGVTVNYIAKWNGSAWSALGAGMNANVSMIKVDSYDNRIYAMGYFDVAGNIPAIGTSIWNGSTWCHTDFLPAAILVLSAAFSAGGSKLFIGWSGIPVTSGAQTSLSNTGKHASYPVIKIKRVGGTGATVKYLKNENSGATLWLNYALMDGETLTIDLRESQRNISSSIFGKVWRALLRNSDTSSFCLMPGPNILNTFVYPAGSPTVTATIEWKMSHWSADGVAA